MGADFFPLRVCHVDKGGINKNGKVAVPASVLIHLKLHYRIYLAIRRGFYLSRMTTNNLISSM